MAHRISHLLLILVESYINLLESWEFIVLNHHIVLVDCILLSNSSLRHWAGSHSLKFLAIISHYFLLRIILWRGLGDWSELMVIVKLMVKMLHLKWTLQRFHMTILRRNQHIVVCMIWYTSYRLLLIWLNAWLSRFILEFFLCAFYISSLVP